MYSIFQVGEIAITQGNAHQDDNNREVEVLGPLQLLTGLQHYRTKKAWPPSWVYPIRWSTGETLYALYWTLRKRYIPPDLEALKREQEAQV